MVKRDRIISCPFRPAYAEEAAFPNRFAIGTGGRQIRALRVLFPGVRKVLSLRLIVESELAFLPVLPPLDSQTIPSSAIHQTRRNGYGTGDSEMV